MTKREVDKTLCGHVGPRGTACIEPAGHNERTAHGDGTVLHWLSPDQRRRSS